MKDEIILGIGEVKLGVHQTSSGIWRGEIILTCSDIIVGLDLLKEGWDKMEKMLKVKNR